MMNQGGRAPGPGRPGQGGPGGGNGKRGPGGAVGLLHVIGGNDRGKQYPLVNPQTQIGRGADQDLILADIAVSRRHVIILIEGERYRLKDLGSGNGSLVNGVRTATSILNDGDQIEIGNTLLRFDHPPSARGGAQAAPPAAQPVMQANAQQRTMIAEAPSGYAAPQQPPQQQFSPPVSSTMAMDGFAQETPSDAFHAPPSRQNQGQSQLPPTAMTGANAAPRGGLLDTPIKKAAIFGTLGAVVLLAGGVVLKKTVFGGNPREEAQKLYLDGTKAFGDGDYDKAKTFYGQAAALNPQSPQITKSLKQCDVELHARGAIKTAQGYATARKWDDELKLLDSIDKSSASYDEAEKLRKQAVPEAIKSYLADANDAMKDDTEAAKQKVEAALLLDPDNAEAQALEQKLKAGGTAQAETKEPAGKQPKGKEPREPKVAKVVQKTHEPAPVKPKKEEEEAPAAGGAGGDLLANKGAAGPYKAKDFVGCATALRMQAKSAKGGAVQKLIAQAAQVQKLGDVYAKAEADKSKNAAQAVSEYTQAIALDGQVGHGTHAAYLKAQGSKLAKDAAKQAMSQQRFDTAFEMAKAAQRFGGDDGGVQGQLKQKANDFNAKAMGMSKRDPNGAKTMWRMVLRMVPPNDPAYVAAQKGLASSAGAKDEDED